MKVLSQMKGASKVVYPVSDKSQYQMLKGREREIKQVWRSMSCGMSTQLPPYHTLEPSCTRCSVKSTMFNKPKWIYFPELPSLALLNYSLKLFRLLLPQTSCEHLFHSFITHYVEETPLHYVYFKPPNYQFAFRANEACPR